MNLSEIPTRGDGLNQIYRQSFIDNSFLPAITDYTVRSHTAIWPAA